MHSFILESLQSVCLQAFASSITGTLAAQAVLKGYGVGDESATVLAATFTWLLKGKNFMDFFFR